MVHFLPPWKITNSGCDISTREATCALYLTSKLCLSFLSLCGRYHSWGRVLSLWPLWSLKLFVYHRKRFHMDFHSHIEYYHICRVPFQMGTWFRFYFYRTAGPENMLWAFVNGNTRGHQTKCSKRKLLLDKKDHGNSLKRMTVSAYHEYY